MVRAAPSRCLSCIQPDLQRRRLLAQGVHGFELILLQQGRLFDPQPLGLLADAGGLALEQFFHAPVQLGMEQALQ
ncbi:hypothetical protein ACU4GD_04090 [Cupriavidus basilensis]